MNKTKIEWADYTWNPVTGCLHGCKYCYARRIAERFEGFECRCGGEEITEESRKYGIQRMVKVCMFSKSSP